LASSSSPGSLLTRATKIPDRIFRAWLAEDYDGKSQWVSIKLSHGSTSVGYKARVAAGDHSGHEPMPVDTLVTATSVHGQIEVLLGQKGWLYGVDFAQMVISGHTGPAINSNGTYDMHWTGGAGGGISITTPPVIQDTHGFTGTPGEMQFSGPSDIVTWVIPDGLGGDYLYGYEELLIQASTDWWPTLGVDNPQDVKYVSTGAADGCGAEIAQQFARTDFNILVNGAIDSTYSSINPNPGNTFWQPAAILVDQPVHLNDGDVMKMQTVWTGGHFFNAIGAAYGNFQFGTQQGVFWLYRLPEDQQTH